MTRKKIILIGGGGHCNSCIDVIELQNKYTIAGIIDISEYIGKSVLGYPIIGSDDDIDNLSKQYSVFFISLGQIQNYLKRKELFEKLVSLKVNLPTIISPLAYVSKHAKLGEGTIIMHHAIVNANATIGKNCIINTKCLIEHDAHIGNHCHISTGAIVNGGVSIGDCSFYGSGAVSKQGIYIPEKSFIKANSIVK